jgi:hypothetical protein
LFIQLRLHPEEGSAKCDDPRSGILGPRGAGAKIVGQARTGQSWRDDQKAQRHGTMMIARLLFVFLLIVQSV